MNILAKFNKSYPNVNFFSLGEAENDQMRKI